MIINKEQFESLLKQHLDDIRENVATVCKHTSDHVWGKEVQIVNKDGSVTKYPLQNWYITIPYDEEMDFETVLKILKFQVRDKELTEVSKVNEYNETQNNVVIEQLCDWCFLEPIFGGTILTNNTITLVKYAVAIKEEDA